MPRLLNASQRGPVDRTALRAAILGADDGIVSTAALVLGVSASALPASANLTAGIAALVAGSMSMAAGEWVSVSGQRDAEVATSAQLRIEIEHDPERQLRALAALLEKRGLTPETAGMAATQMSEYNAVAALEFETLGVNAETGAKPLTAAVASAGSFAAGASLPLAAIALAPGSVEGFVVFVVALAGLAALGWLGAGLGGARPGPAIRRVILGGGAAMIVTALVGVLSQTFTSLG